MYKSTNKGNAAAEKGDVVCRCCCFAANALKENSDISPYISHILTLIECYEYLVGLSKDKPRPFGKACDSYRQSAGFLYFYPEVAHDVSFENLEIKLEHVIFKSNDEKDQGIIKIFIEIHRRIKLMRHSNPNFRFENLEELTRRDKTVCRRALRKGRKEYLGLLVEDLKTMISTRAKNGLDAGKEWT